MPSCQAGRGVMSLMPPPVPLPGPPFHTTSVMWVPPPAALATCSVVPPTAST